MSLRDDERTALLQALRTRFDENPHRHQGIEWIQVEARLEARPDKLKALRKMERTGGEPDVVGANGETGEILFFDCAPESPTGRRSVAYDQQGRESRKKHQPATSALEMAAEMGIDLLTEEDYRRLQSLGPVDTKTSSWIQTPSQIRALGGALFGDHRYGSVFIYHNGAQSYYAARGFRGKTSA